MLYISSDLNFSKDQTRSIFEAECFAKDRHSKVNHIYDVYPYSFHLEMVVEYAIKHRYVFFENIGTKSEFILALKVCWLHDTIEDCRMTYNDVKDKFGEKIADCVYDLTTYKGKTRSERANDQYYQDLKQNKIALFVKICDRLANMHYSFNISKSKKMSKVYLDEFDSFKEKLYTQELNKMWKSFDPYIKTDKQYANI